MAQVSLPYTLQAGQPENVNQLVANLDALVTGVNTVNTAQIADGNVTPAKTATAVVSSLPTTGLVDGMEISYQSAGMATDGQVWRLKYRSGSSSSYKWEFVGGSPLRVQELSALTTGNSSTTYTSFSTQVRIQTPLAGEYEAQAWIRRLAPSTGTVTQDVRILPKGTEAASDSLASFFAWAGTDDKVRYSAQTAHVICTSTASGYVELLTKTGLAWDANDVVMTLRPVRVG